jgi:glycosyltransferase involved in cell wall biosynthesis
VELELVLVDDMPTESCEEFAKQYSARHLPFPPFERRQGPSNPWNAGLRAAKGDVLAVTHPENIPGRDCARFLHDPLMGIENEFEIWINHHDLVDKTKLPEFAARLSAPILCLPEGFDFAGIDWKRDPDLMSQVHGMAESPHYLSGGNFQNARFMERMTHDYMWNGLIAMRREVWEWMNYFRASDSAGVDDAEFFARRVHLGILAAHAYNSPYAYHQWHTEKFHGWTEPQKEYNTMAEARLVDLFPETADAPRPFKLYDGFASLVKSG